MSSAKKNICVAVNLSRFCMIFLVITCGVVRYSIAQNLGFMPGDAFFVVALSEQQIDSLPDEGGKVILPHKGPLIDQLNFGGYAGFNNLQIDGVSPQMIKGLRQAYHDYRKYTPKIVRIDVKEDGTRNETEVNSPIIFIYNRDVDWLQQRIALKYNEDWPHLPDKAFEGPGRNLALNAGCVRAEIYQPLIETFNAIVEDWRQAEQFKPLKVKVPKNIAWGKSHKPIKEPVVVHCRDIQIVMPMNEDLEEYVWQKPENEFYQITLDGTKVFEWEKSEEGIELITSDICPSEGKNDVCY